MPRIKRGLVDGFIYHVINRGNGRREVFHKPQDYNIFLNLMKEAKQRYTVKIFAYCLMPNHFHIVIMPEKAEFLSKWMQWLMTSHVRKYHKHYGSSGHIWQGRFKSFPIQQDSYLIMALKYVELNPLRAGLVSSLEEWEWSSQIERIGKSRLGLLDDPPVELPEDWKAYLNTAFTDRELEILQMSIKRQSPLGEKEWVEYVCKNYGMESTLRKVGRPKKGDRLNFLKNDF